MDVAYGTFYTVERSIFISGDGFAGKPSHAGARGEKQEYRTVFPPVKVKDANDKVVFIHG